jgi:Putative zinc ribbon domain
MPLKRDEQRGGTNADGSKSTTYCSHCYQKGEFLLPDLSVEQMQDRVNDKLAEFGIPRFLMRLFTRRIPKLERWQDSPTGA